jgi:hypothetical protein
MRRAAVSVTVTGMVVFLARQCAEASWVVAAVMPFFFL